MCSLRGVLLLVSAISVSLAAPNLGIIGGDLAEIKDYPYMVSLHNGTEHVCGGSILNERTILTAGHCISKLSGEESFILYGNSDYTSAKRVDISSTIVYPDFENLPPWRYDIALLKLNSSITLGETAQPVKLPKQNERSPYEKEGVVPGWGTTNWNRGNPSHLLHAVELTIPRDGVCKNSFNPGSHEQWISPKFQLCAAKKGKAACGSDFGGPLVVEGIQYGIGSFSLSCGSDPTVFTRVSVFVDWINENL